MNQDFDIKIEGRGIWFTIHITSINATTEPLKVAFQLMMEQLAQHLGCEVCKKHLQSFMTQVPIRSYWRNEAGLFRWGWELHNQVNVKLGKQVTGYEEALLKYKNFVCRNCDDSVTESKILVPIVGTFGARGPTTSTTSKQDGTEPTFNLLSYW